MNTLRGLLFDNLGLKLVALLLAVLVYLNVYTDRPASMMTTFRIQVTGLADSLTLSGPAPAAVQAELRGTGKQLILLRVTEPALRLSLSDVKTGRFTRAITAADLPLPSGIELVSENSLSPSQVELQVDRKSSRLLPVTARVDGVPPAGVHWNGDWSAHPAMVRLTGPAQVLAALDSVPLANIGIGGKRDSLRVRVTPVLPDWTTSQPPMVEVVVQLGSAAHR